MQNDDDDQATAGSDEGKSDALLKAFASHLGRELDRIGYPAAPTRTNQLSQDLELGRMQAYRMGRGDSMPTLKSLVKLHSLGVSIDAVLAQLQEKATPDDEVAVTILNVALRAVPLPAYGSTPFALSRRDGRTVLRVVASGQGLGPEDTLVGGLRFTRPQPHVALVDDDRADLAVLAKEIGQGYSVSPFLSGNNLLDDMTDLEAYDAFVLDWRLQDIDGAELVKHVRSKTRAPIIITTGERQEAPAISAVLSLPHVRYADKPIEGNLLRAMIESAISEGGFTPSRTVAWSTKSNPPSA